MKRSCALFFFVAAACAGAIALLSGPTARAAYAEDCSVAVSLDSPGTIPPVVVGQTIMFRARVTASCSIERIEVEVRLPGENRFVTACETSLSAGGLSSCPPIPFTVEWRDFEVSVGEHTVANQLTAMAGAGDVRSTLRIGTVWHVVCFDVTHDGLVDDADVRTAARRDPAADVDFDGAVTSRDVTILAHKRGETC